MSIHRNGHAVLSELICPNHSSALQTAWTLIAQTPLLRHKRWKLRIADCPATVEQYLILRLAREPWEVFAVLFLYCRHRLQAFKTLFQA